MNVSDNCIYFTRFIPDMNGNGGCRRFLQMREILENVSCRFITLQDLPKDRLISKLIRYFISGLKIDFIEKYLITHGQYFSWSKDFRDSVYFYNHSALKCLKAIKKSTTAGIIIVDDPIFFSPLVSNINKGKGIKVIGICHNIESLSGGQAKDNKQFKLLKKEIEALSLCDLVITISREEHSFLNNLNVRSYYYPYYPIDTIEENLLRIRKARMNTSKRDVLLLGTAYNLPTKFGMEKVISSWKRNSENHHKLLVAGYGTEDLKVTEDVRNIELLGSITNEKLEYLLSSAAACLCYQEKASGALTRIMEMLIAGVPVIANTSACRSYYNLPGVIEIDNLDETRDALKKASLLDGNFPVPPSPNDQNLLEKLNELILP